MTEDQAAINELKAMNREELDLVQYENVWWVCCCKGCNNSHRVRDYGIFPEYYSNRWGFFSVFDKIYFCSRHWKYHKRLVPVYGIERFALKFIDNEKALIHSNEQKIKLKNNRVK